MAKADITGRVGAVPPPDAPRETTQALTADAGGAWVRDPETGGEVFMTAQEQAARNEKVLPPFKVAGPRPVVAPAPLPPAPAPSTTADLIADVFGPEPPAADPIPELDATQGEVDQLVDILPPLSEADRARMPAASDTDSPAKGLLPGLVPQQRGDKWEGISKGGFADAMEAQYYPLSGDELKVLVQAMAKQLFEHQIENDLRFSIALTYPRVRVSLKLEVVGHAEDPSSGFTIEKRIAPKAGEPGGTALAIASRLADQVVFVVEAVRQEFTEDGESDRPPDQIRDEIGLPKPRKQQVESAYGVPQMVDILAGGQEERHP